MFRLVKSGDTEADSIGCLPAVELSIITNQQREILLVYYCLQFGLRHVKFELGANVCLPEGLVVRENDDGQRESLDHELESQPPLVHVTRREAIIEHYHQKHYNVWQKEQLDEEVGALRGLFCCYAI